MTLTTTILNLFRVLRITNNVSIPVALLLSLFLVFQGTFCCAFEQIDFDTDIYQIGSVHEKQLNKEADDYFYAGINSADKEVKEAYLSKALGRYMLLLKMHPDNPIYCTKIAVIHDTCHHCPQAKDYFHRAINLENLNPFANFYFGEYYFIQRDYNNAIRHYLIAYNNGYKSKFILNLRLATIYERVGDIEKAKKHYHISEQLSPEQTELSSKIQALNDVYYAQENYTDKTIRE